MGFLPGSILGGWFPMEAEHFQVSVPQGGECIWEGSVGGGGAGLPKPRLPGFSTAFAFQEEDQAEFDTAEIKGRDQIKSLTRFSISCLGRAPTFCLTTFPSLKTMRVGMEMMPYWEAMSPSSSTFTLPTLSFPL